MASQSQMLKIKDFENFSIFYQKIIPQNQIALLSDVIKTTMKDSFESLKILALNKHIMVP